MRLLGYLDKKTKAKFPVDNVENPTYVGTGHIVSGRGCIEGTEDMPTLQKLMVMEVTFKVEPKTGMFIRNIDTAQIRCIDIDNGLPFILISSDIAFVMEGVTSGSTQITPEGYFKANFVFHKVGQRIYPSYIFDINAFEFNRI